MKLSVRGRSTSSAEVQDVTKSGVWIYVKGREYFLPYSEYPWFKTATVSDVYNVQLLHGKHLHWPSLDVDLELESLNHPQSYPLLYSA